MKQFILSLSLIFFVNYIIGCSGTPAPTITITALDCPTNNIAVSVTAVKAGSSPNFTVTVTATVTCSNSPVSNGEINVNYAYSDYKATTDTSGVAKKTIKTACDPAGSTVNVTVKGSDGKEKVISVQVK